MNRPIDDYPRPYVEPALRFIKDLRAHGGQCVYYRPHVADDEGLEALITFKAVGAQVKGDRVTVWLA